MPLRLAGIAQIEEQSEWSLTVHSDYGFSVIIRELMRADVDGDNNEEILVFVLAFAQQGTYRAGIVERAKVNDGGFWHLSHFKGCHFREPRSD
jgi:hypothetical protein